MIILFALHCSRTVLFVVLGVCIGKSANVVSEMSLYKDSFVLKGRAIAIVTRFSGWGESSGFIYYRLHPPSSNELLI